MTIVESPKLLKAELGRWRRDRAVWAVLIFTVLLVGALTYLAALVASGQLQSASGSGSVSIETDGQLTPQSADIELAMLSQSILTMVLPLASVVLGALFAGSEMGSGALLSMSVAARRVRRLFSLRLLVLAAALSGMSLLAAFSSSVASLLALSGQELDQLSVWSYFWLLVAGSMMQAFTFGGLSYGLCIVTRRWVLVVLTMWAYVVVFEPLVQSLLPRGSKWLPREATGALMTNVSNAWLYALPSVTLCVAIATVAVLALRKDRVFR